MARAIISITEETFGILRKEKFILNSKNPKRRYTWDDFFKELIKR